MSVVKKWTCDGCGDETETPLDADTCKFYQLKVTAGAWGGDFVLCDRCHSKLLENADPRKWPRLVRERAA